MVFLYVISTNLVDKYFSNADMIGVFFLPLIEALIWPLVMYNEHVLCPYLVIL